MKLQSKKNNKGAKAAPMLKAKKKRTRVRAKKKVNLMERLSQAAAVKNGAPKKATDNKSLLVAQEVKFARLLAHNDKKVRDKVLKNLKRWMTVRSQSSFAFTEEDFLRLWKGLFYCMWLSDKPLVQEDLAESLSNLVHCFDSDVDTALLYTKCTLKSLATEWFGIDSYRVDKFEMLVRRILRQTFAVCRSKSWKKKCVVGVGKVMEEILLDAKTCLGLKLHITNVYMEELAKIGEGKIPESVVTEFIRPFVIYLACVDDVRQISHVVKNIFRYLIFQSEVGSDYLEKYEAWRRSNFPCDNIDEMQKIEMSDDEDEALNEEEEEAENSQNQEKPLDPRAGMVDVELPPIPIDASQIAQVLKENKFHQASTAKNRKWISKLINDFTKLCQGEMPIGMKKVPQREDYYVNTYQATKELLNLNNELYSDSSKNNKKRKKKNDGKAELNINEMEESTAHEINDESIKVISKSKKQKLSEICSEEKEDSTKNNNKLTEKAKKIKQKKKVKLVKKNTTKVNVSNSLAKKKLKESSKNLTDTVSECAKEPENSSVSGTNTDKKVPKNKNDVSKKSVKKSETISEDSTKVTKTASNWNVENVTSKSKLTSTPRTSKSEKMKKKKSIAENGKNKDPFPNNVSWLTPVLTRLEQSEINTPTSTNSALQTPKTDSTKKRVQIALQKNMAQNTSEYFRKILQNPGIPFDANRKPKVGVLKPSPLPSPVNPFYKRKSI